MNMKIYENSVVSPQGWNSKWTGMEVSLLLHWAILALQKVLLQKENVKPEIGV